MAGNYQVDNNTSGSELNDILRPLNDEEFSELLKLYKEKYKSNGFQFLLLHTQREWNRQLKEIKIDEESPEWISFRKAFYTHRNGDFRKFGTYVCIHHDLIQSVAFHTWEPNCNELFDCLSKTSLIQWQMGPLLISVPNDYSDIIKKFILSKGIKIIPRQCQGFILTTDKALKLELTRLPEGYKETVLKEEHADLIYSLWANKKEASINYIKGFIKLKRCIGIMEESNDKLVGWIFQNEFSGLGILQVLPSAQRKGLGEYLTISMSKLIAETSQVHPSAFAVVGNIRSESLLQKIGYERIVVYEWIQLERK